MFDADRVHSAAAEDEAARRATYDWASTSPSTAVVETVAEATDRGPMALPQLYDTIDTDALDSLFRPDGGPVSVSLAFAGCDVTVRSDGEVAVRPAGSDE
jgi:hypothetical protein